MGKVEGNSSMFKRFWKGIAVCVALLMVCAGLIFALVVIGVNLGFGLAEVKVLAKTGVVVVTGSLLLVVWLANRHPMKGFIWRHFGEYFETLELKRLKFVLFLLSLGTLAGSVLDDIWLLDENVKSSNALFVSEKLVWGSTASVMVAAGIFKTLFAVSLTSKWNSTSFLCGALWTVEAAAANQLATYTLGPAASILSGAATLVFGAILLQPLAQKD